MSLFDAPILQNIWLVRSIFFLILLTPAVSWILYSRYHLRILKVFPIVLVSGVAFFSLFSIGGYGYGFGYVGLIWIVGFILITRRLSKYGIVEAMYLSIFLILFANNLWGTELSPILFYLGWQSDIVNFSMFYVAYFINIPFFYKLLDVKRMVKLFVIFVVVFVPLNLYIFPPAYMFNGDKTLYLPGLLWEIEASTQRVLSLVLVMMSIKPNVILWK